MKLNIHKIIKTKNKFKSVNKVLKENRYYIKAWMILGKQGCLFNWKLRTY